MLLTCTSSSLIPLLCSSLHNNTIAAHTSLHIFQRGTRSARMLYPCMLVVLYSNRCCSDSCQEMNDSGLKLQTAQPPAQLEWPHRGHQSHGDNMSLERNKQSQFRL
ncbi:unnamed protein product [Arctogadus glacialis]